VALRVTFAIYGVGEVTVKGLPTIGPGFEFQTMLQATAPPVPSDSRLDGLNGLEGDGGAPDPSGALNAGNGVVGIAGVGGTSINGTEHASVVQREIDNPADPANKYLGHAAVQSSEMMNMYTGNVVLDADGAAVVQLPGWFRTENADFRYSLSAVGAPRAESIRRRRGSRQPIQSCGRPRRAENLLVRDGHPTRGIRQSQSARSGRGEETKGTGYYMNPELYGQA
jgi:hypothetical protein